MARIEKNVVESQSATDWGDTLPAFVREVSWLRWLGPLSAERRLTNGFCGVAGPLFPARLGAARFWGPLETQFGELPAREVAPLAFLPPSAGVPRGLPS